MCRERKNIPSTADNVEAANTNKGINGAKDNTDETGHIVVGGHGIVRGHGLAALGSVGSVALGHRPVQASEHEGR